MDKITSRAQLTTAIQSHHSFILIFSAIWSGISESTRRNFERVGAKYPTLYQAWISTDDNPELAGDLNVSSIPAEIGFKGGVEVVRYIGPKISDAEVEEFIREVL
ncbi:hypothetical protein BO94DRAFT_301970 [Aspergillus sclerotioniger CBS 115572]|uniref:Thioredoxin domain-containing protein n=1 Tax=Aspergillus sclerotioniger CBS 115572 TaxID=1450535 RepID=A0A317V2P2_9EURO|nr:hypothetical protein BO94DRAFT_301970 [Aspergillus sclerotioniger CBS 115572]PWY68554.1 hypothetical protein BO94DRAFT_301970 [Aspergillus sclerotioniger CBS 115572]